MHTYICTYTHTYTQRSSQCLSNRLQIDSVHVSLWEGEAVFWSVFALDTIRTYSKRSPKTTNTENASTNAALDLASLLFSLPVSMVTTVEASDLSLVVRMDTPTLQSKEPVYRVVMASGAANVQWNAVEEESTTIRLVINTCMFKMYSTAYVCLH